MKQKIGGKYEQKDSFENRKEMLVPYMFHDKSSDGPIEERKDYKRYGAGYQSNANLQKNTQLYVAFVKGYDNLHDWQRQLGVNWMR